MMDAVTCKSMRQKEQTCQISAFEQRDVYDLPHLIKTVCVCLYKATKEIMAASSRANFSIGIE